MMCEKKIRKSQNVKKVQLYAIFVLHTVRMVPSNVRKNTGTRECDKSTVTCDIEPAQYEDGTIKFEKNKGTMECDKSTITCDVEPA